MSKNSEISTSRIFSQFKNCDDDTISIYLRKNFTLSKSSLKSISFDKYKTIFKQQSILLIYLIDKTFFQQLSERLHLQKKFRTHFLLIKDFFDTIKAKLGIFEEFVTDIFNNLKLLSLKGFQTEQARRSTIENQSFHLSRYFLPYTVKFLQIYSEQILKESHPIFQTPKIKNYLVSEDRELLKYMKEQLEKTTLLNSNSFKKPVLQTSKSHFHIKFFYKEFLQKLLFKLEEVMRNYLPQIQSTDDTASHLISSSGVCTEKTHLLQKNVEILQYRKQFINNIEIEESVSTKCINCSQFFYKDLDFENDRNSVVDYEIIPSVKMIKKNPNSILENITAFLNNGGGTLLFDCRETAFGFLPQGQQMNLKQQQGYKHSFENLTKFIIPQPQRKLIQYQIDFIPLKLNPMRNLGTIVSNSHELYVQRKFISQKYVMRVRLMPRGQIEFFGCQLDHKDYFYVRRKGKTIQIKSSELYNEIKKKSYQYYPLVNQQRILKLFKKPENMRFHNLIKGRRYHPPNLHEGTCKETLILSAGKQDDQY